MKNLARRCLCCAALAAVLVPAAAAERSAAHLHMRASPARAQAAAIPDHLLPFGTGFGAGTWRLPESGAGAATAQLCDPSGRVRYVVRATLARSGELPPVGSPDGGGFYGELLAVQGTARVPVAQIEGVWIREPGGAGSFVASILVPTENPDSPLEAIGMVQGTLRGPVGVSQLQLYGGGDSHAVTTLGRLTLTWSIGIPEE
jgi:hypothetical protein